jgi:hypothetical protein
MLMPMSICLCPLLTLRVVVAVPPSSGMVVVVLRAPLFQQPRVQRRRRPLLQLLLLLQGHDARAARGGAERCPTRHAVQQRVEWAGRGALQGVSFILLLPLPLPLNDRGGRGRGRRRHWRRSRASSRASRGAGSLLVLVRLAPLVVLRVRGELCLVEEAWHGLVVLLHEAHLCVICGWWLVVRRERGWGGKGKSATDGGDSEREGILAMI